MNKITILEEVTDKISDIIKETISLKNITYNFNFLKNYVKLNDSEIDEIVRCGFTQKHISLELFNNIQNTYPEYTFKEAVQERILDNTILNSSFVKSMSCINVHFTILKEEKYREKFLQNIIYSNIIFAIKIDKDTTLAETITLEEYDKYIKPNSEAEEYGFTDFINKILLLMIIINENKIDSEWDRFKASVNEIKRNGIIKI